MPTAEAPTTSSSNESPTCRMFSAGRPRYRIARWKIEGAGLYRCSSSDVMTKVKLRPLLCKASRSSIVSMFDTIAAGIEVSGEPELREHLSEGVSMEVAEGDERFRGKLFLHRLSPSLRGHRVDGTPSLAKQSFEDRWESMGPALEEGSESVEGEPAETAQVRSGDDDPRATGRGPHGFARDATR